MIPQDVLVPYLVTNIISAGLIFLAYRWPRVTRVLFVVIFTAAGLFNIITAIRDPQAYTAFKELAVLAIYKEFIGGFFSEHARVIILIIAVGQLCVGALLLGSGHLFKSGIIGGTIFLVAIAPLGFGSAFPSTILMVGALYITKWRLHR
jgi:hypothetical protein